MSNLAKITSLAQFAVAHNNASRGGTPTFELSIEDARARIKIKDGNKVKKEGVQALTLVLGKIGLGLDAIAPAATRLNITDDKVEGVTKQLQEAIDGGVFDDAIVAAQAKGKAAAEKAAATKAAATKAAATKAAAAAKAEAGETEAPEGVDLDALEGVEAADDDTLDDE